MTTLRTIVSAADYLYICRFSSSEQTRYYLNGVFVDTANKRMVATDGLRLGLLDVGESMTPTAAPSFILANAKDLQRACKAGNYESYWLRCYDDRVEIVAAGSSADVAMAAPGAVDPVPRMVATIPANVAYVDGTFPDYERVVPSECSGLTDGYAYNAKYIAAFTGPEPKQTLISLVPNGTSPALVFNSDKRFLGVLMPARGGVGTKEACERADSFKRRPALAVAAE